LQGALAAISTSSSMAKVVRIVDRRQHQSSTSTMDLVSRIKTAIGPAATYVRGWRRRNLALGQEGAA
jgi:hypothetical protein